MIRNRLQASLFSLIALLLLETSTVLLAQQNFNFEHLDVDDGLTYGVVNCIFQDSRGLIWIGTDAGLNLYDGLKITQYVHESQEPNSLSSSFISNILEGPEQELWINTLLGVTVYSPGEQLFERDITSWLEKYGLPSSEVASIQHYKNDYWFLIPNSGIVRYNKVEESSSIVSIADFGVSASSANLFSFALSSEGNLWVVSSDGKLFLIDRKTLEISKVVGYVGQSRKSAPNGFELFVDSDNDLWVYPSNGDVGVFCFKQADNQWVNYSVGSAPIKLNNNLVRDITQGPDGKIWIGTDHGGINLLDKVNNTISYITHDAKLSKSLVNNSIISLYKDHDDIIWIGTYKNGINYYHPDLIKFDHIQHAPSKPNSLPFDDVNQFVEDQNGLWIGTNGLGLLHYDRSSKTYKQFRNVEGDIQSLSSDVIVSMLLDSNNKLWVGTFYGGLNKYDGKRFTRFLPDENDKNAISGENVWDLYEDTGGNIWISTLNDGVDLWNKTESTFRNFPMRGSGSPGALNLDFVYAIAEDNAGHIWIGGGNGIDMIDQQKLEVVADYSGPPLHEGITVTCLHNDNQQRMWIGTLEGLYVYDFTTGGMKHYNATNGLPNDNIQAILQDENNDIWLSTADGITRIKNQESIDTSSRLPIANFDVNDGLQGSVFNRNAALKLQNGQLIFGGPNGYNVISPNALHLNKKAAKIIITDLKVRGESVIKDPEKNKGFFFNPIDSHQELKLKHFENIVTIDFAALNYLHPQKNKYEYYLEGFESSWKSVTNYPSITYTNLDPGRYVFKMRVSNNDGVWIDQAMQLPIRITPPFWKTNWAYFLYFLLITGALYLARQIVLIKERANFLIEQERRDAQNLEKLNKIKMRFFTNISHELRTPISLILAPLESLKSLTNDPAIEKQHQVIQKNAKKLLRMVDQLLDFRKLDLKKLDFHAAPGDIISFIAMTVRLFEQLAESEGIKLFFYSSMDQLMVNFDKDKMEKILYNLLSNAIKFTPRGGMVRVEVTAADQVASTNNERLLAIKIIDNGIGISEEDKDRIFDRFFNTTGNQSIVNHGSGIGLAIVHEFVKAHNGHIKVESQLGKGATFSVFIPYVEAQQEVLPKKAPEPAHLQDKRSVLVIEDNIEFKDYLTNSLSEKYKVSSAVNGKEGWQMILTELPDLIVSDLMMPIMDGIELCQKLKNDSRTAHIPFIMLTASRGEKSKLEGFEKGADDYIVKPFSFDILNSRIKNLIDQRDKIETIYRKKLTLVPVETPIESRDELLMKNAVSIVLENISDSSLNVERLAKELNISRVQLYKKMVAILEKTPVQFIRDIRLEQAAQLLEKSQLTVAEIAFKVGFSDRKYLSTYFKQKYGKSPSKYQKDMA